MNHMGSIITTSSRSNVNDMSIDIESGNSYPKSINWPNQNCSNISEVQHYCNPIKIIHTVIDELEGVKILTTERDNSKTVITLCMVEHGWIFFCTVCDNWFDLKACFDKPEAISNTNLLQCINSWNTYRRFTRLTVDHENDLWLRADFPLSHQHAACLKLTIGDCIYAFGAAMLEYQSYILTEASESNVMMEQADIETHTEVYKCREKDEEEKCALCLENFKVNETCLRLPCGHMFHRAEVERYLYTASKCPLCRSSIELQ